MATNTTATIIPTRRRVPIDVIAASAVTPIAQCKTACSSCNLREMCLPCCGLSTPERDLADRLAFSRSRFRRGEHLYRSGDRFGSLYAVRNGFFKSVAVLDNGREQVTGFSMAGEVLGLDGIAPERHAFNCVALEDAEVCAIPFGGLQALALEIPSLQRHFYKMMSREIARGQGVMLQLGSMNAEERLAMFLLNLSRRYAARGSPELEFTLRMTREEIGSYLSLTLETVSRTFSRLQNERLICVQQRLIRILNRTGLEGVLGRGDD